MSQQRLFLLFFAMIFMIIATSCSKNETVEKPNEEAEDPIEGEEETSVYKYPLTGIETNETVDHRIVGVMVNNQVQARPQSGLSKADIVFEILAEGSITRFLALFHSEQPEIVEPVLCTVKFYV